MTTLFGTQPGSLQARIPLKAICQRYCLLSSVSLIPVLLTGNQLVAAEQSSQTPDNAATTQRFVAAKSSEKKPADPANSTAECIYDRSSGLLWEVKTRQPGLRNARQSYSWYQPDMRINGGFPGYRNHGSCELLSCDTQSYIAAINKLKLCGYSNWRLPTREELRSLVDYSITYPGPMINRKAFPNTQSQFYWSSTPDASEKDSAWGIGFSFGYDYAYYKSDHGYIRLVSGPNP